jgi:hypothetical protein
LTSNQHANIFRVDRAWTKSKAHLADETVASRKESAMQKYSDFFKTLHDEQGPTGYLGRGTHYSVLRAVVFHEPTGKPLREGQFADFAVIWDEDHDTRVIEPIEEIYRRGLLSSFLMFGEHKGFFTSILSRHVRGNFPAQSVDKHIDSLKMEITAICQSLSDPWPSKVVYRPTLGETNPIISDDDKKVNLYLNNLEMLWQLGTAAVPPIEANTLAFNPLFLKKVDQLKLSVRADNCLKNDNIVYVGDLVQKYEAEMLRTPNFGRSCLNEITEVLVKMGLHLGMEVPGWPPENIEELSKRFETWP